MVWFLRKTSSLQMDSQSWQKGQEYLEVLKVGSLVWIMKWHSSILSSLTVSFLCGSFHAWSNFQSVVVALLKQRRRTAVLKCGFCHDGLKRFMSLNYFEKFGAGNVFYPCMFPFMFLQMGHLGECPVTLQATDGFSPVWILSCLCKLAFWLKALPHSAQSNGFSPVSVCTISLSWCSLDVAGSTFILAPSSSSSDWLHVGNCSVISFPYNARLPPWLRFLFRGCSKTMR